MKPFAITVIAIVAIAVIGGFFVVGSPQEERLRRLDGERVSHLQYIQSEVLNYWINKSVLPASLADLRDDLRGITIPIDPETGSPYTYSVKGPLTFSICATFARPSEGAPVDRFGTSKPVVPVPMGYYDGLSQNWQHIAGQVCFDRTIDEDFYKPRSPIQK